MTIRILQIIPLVAALTCVSCGTVRFYHQAIHGQMEILHKARPMDDVKRDPATSAVLREKLELVERLRDFARDELALPAKKQFHTYADLGRSYVIANLFAAPEFSLEAKIWWYPFAGTVKYRGFFDVKMAKIEASALKKDGWDVFIGAVRVYSTLGWFHDPVLNTFIEDDEASLAETLFHEMTHTRVYLAGDTDFNEAFATAVAREGVRRWLRKNGDAAKLARYEKSLQNERAALQLLHSTRGQLASLYSKKDAMTEEAMRQEKIRILAGAQARYESLKHRGASADHDGWFNGQFNNARIISVAAYFDLVPSFDQMLRERGGDLQKLYTDVEAMRVLTKDERRAKLTRAAP